MIKMHSELNKNYKDTSNNKTKEVILLLTIKLHNTKTINNNKKAIIEGIEKAVELVERWVDYSNIARVVNCDRLIRREDFLDINQ